MFPGYRAGRGGCLQAHYVGVEARQLVSHQLFPVVKVQVGAGAVPKHLLALGVGLGGLVLLIPITASHTHNFKPLCPS
eukprot:scaffold363584_cov19-Prasinocladus_malaysianus.AAC.1